MREGVGACMEGVHSYRHQVWGQAGIVPRALHEDNYGQFPLQHISSNPTCPTGLKGKKVWPRTHPHFPELGGPAWH